MHVGFGLDLVMRRSLFLLCFVVMGVEILFYFECEMVVGNIKRLVKKLALGVYPYNIGLH